MKCSERACSAALISMASFASGGRKGCCREPSGAAASVLGDHADMLAQGFLVTSGDVLTVDQNASTFHVMKRSSKLTSVDLPAPERPTRPIFRLA